jgi:hypothetical protein
MLIQMLLDNSVNILFNDSNQTSDKNSLLLMIKYFSHVAKAVLLNLAISLVHLQGYLEEAPLSLQCTRLVMTLQGLDALLEQHLKQLVNGLIQQG